MNKRNECFDHVFTSISIHDCVGKASSTAADQDRATVNSYFSLFRPYVSPRLTGVCRTFFGLADFNPVLQNLSVEHSRSLTSPVQFQTPVG